MPAIDPAGPPGGSPRWPQWLTNRLYAPLQTGRVLPRAEPVWPPPVAGLLAAAYLAWLIYGALGRALLSLRSLLLLPVGFIGAAFLAALCATFLAARNSQSTAAKTTGWADPLLWRTGAIAVWLVPAAILLRGQSGWAALVALLIAAATTELLTTYRSMRQAGTEPLATLVENHPRELLSPFPASPRTPYLWALSTALCLQAGIVSMLTGESLVATAWLSAGAALYAYRRTAIEEAAVQRRRRPVRSALLSLLFAMLFTAVTLIPYLLLPLGGEGANTAGVRTAAPAAAHAPEQPEEEAHRRAAATNVDNSHPGVILLPKEKPHVVLVPPLPSLSHDVFSVRHPEPLTIPFFGVYWFLRPPDRSPPPNSLLVRGSADELSFLSVTHRPLVMEARQNLGKLINLTCCRAIQVVISNADRFPGTVILELQLFNTMMPGRPFQRLGSAEVSSSIGWRQGGLRGVAPETLTFAIPPHPVIDQFDELRVVFRLAQMRAERSARIGIERFVLVPRGL